MNRRIILPILAVLAALGYGGYRYYLSHAPLQWSGTVEARTMEIGSRVGGRVQEVKVREGDSVKAGQEILVLEPGDLPAQRLQAQGQLETAEGALEKVTSQNLPTARRAEIAAAQARLDAEQISLEKTRLDNERMSKLLAAGAATRQDADNTDSAMRNAVAQVAALRASLDQLLQGTPQDVKSAQGAVDSAKGKLQQIEVMLGELVVTAPRDAKVESLDLRPGDILAPNAVAAKLLEPSELYVRIYVPETEMGYIHPSARVPIFVDSFPGKAFVGVVEYVNSEGEFSPRNLQTADERADQVFASRVRIEEGAGILRAGMAAFIKVPR